MYEFVLAVVPPWLIAGLGFFVAVQFWQLRHTPYVLMYHEKRMISISFILIGSFYGIIWLGNDSAIPRNVAMIRVSLLWLELTTATINRRIKNGG